MAEIRQRGCFTRLEPSSVLVDCRRLLEEANLKMLFPVAVLYADWSAHARLDRAGAAAVLLEITEALNRDIRDSSNPSIDSLYNAVLGALRLRTLQSELIDLCARFGVETWAFQNPRMFRQFIGAILDAIADLPLAFPAGIAHKTGKVKKIYESACRAARNDPQWIVTQCSVTNELSAQQLAFYDVPAGTYLWQIRTASNVFFCGVL